MTPIVELRAGAACARLAPALGARISALHLVRPTGERVQILYPYPETATSLLPWAKGGLYPLIPYSGRIEQARLLHEGKVIHLAAHPGGEPHTLHGVSQRRAWVVIRSDEHSATLRYLHEPDADWPWAFAAILAVRLESHRCTIDLSLTNRSATSMPAGVGAHPYVHYEIGDEISFKAGPEWIFDADFLAQAPRPGQVSTVTLRAAALASDLTRFHGDWDGKARLRRRDGTELQFNADAGLRHLVVHRPAGTDYVCVEPVSHVANGFNLNARGIAGTGTRILAAGQTLSGRFDVAVVA